MDGKEVSMNEKYEIYMSLLYLSVILNLYI